MIKDVFITTNPEILYTQHEPTPLENIYLILINSNGFLVYKPIAKDGEQILQSTTKLKDQETILIFQKTKALEQSLGLILKHPEQEILRIGDGIEVVYSNGELECYRIKGEQKTSWNPPQTLDSILATLYPIIHPRQQRNLKGEK